MPNTIRVQLTADNIESFDLNSLIGRHVKFKYEGWTKVYQVKALLTKDSGAVVLSVNENMRLSNYAKKLLTEENPTLIIKEKRWWKLW